MYFLKMITLHDNCKKTPLMILHLRSVFSLCVPEQFAKLDQLYQLLHTCSLKKHSEQGGCALHAPWPQQAAGLPSPPLCEELQNCIASAGKDSGTL